MRYSASVIFTFLLGTSWARGDAFDHYTNPILSKIPQAQGVEKVKKLTQEMMIKNSRVLPNINAAFLVVKTNEGRMSRLLALPARHKVNKDKTIPILLVERFVTFREGEEQTIQAQGQNVRVFSNFHLNLDIAQIVPADLAADLRFVVEGEEVYLEPLGKAELYLVTKHLSEANPPKGGKLTVGDKFDPSYFSGNYKLYDDGRRSGKLVLKWMDNGEVIGFYYSDKDGQRYEVAGKVGNPNHTLQFTIVFPRTAQTFNGFLFTGDARAISGTSRLQERETGFYAIRLE